MIRVLALVAVLCVPAAAQLNPSLQFSFTEPLFTGNGNIGICMDNFTGSGDIWVVDFSNTINLFQFNSAGMMLANYPTNVCAPSLPSPNGITQDAFTGNLWIVDNTSAGDVLEMDLAGNCIGGFNLGGAFSNPVSITFAANTGTLWVGHTGAIDEFTTAGVPTGASISMSALGVISGLSHDPVCNRFFAVAGGNTVYEYDTAGNQLSTSTLPTIIGAQGMDYDRSSALMVVTDNSATTLNVFSVTVPGCAPSPYPGTPMGDLIIASGVNGTPVPGQYVQSATALDVIILTMSSPAGTYDLQPFVLLGQPFVTGVPPLPTIPGLVWLDLTQPYVVLINIDPFLTQTLDPGGTSYLFVMPPGFVGQSFLFQGACVTPALSITDGHEIQVM